MDAKENDVSLDMDLVNTVKSFLKDVGAPLSIWEKDEGLDDDDVSVLYGYPEKSSNVRGSSVHIRTVDKLPNNTLDLTDTVKLLYPDRKIDEGLLREFAIATGIDYSGFILYKRRMGNDENVTKCEESPKCEEIPKDEESPEVQFLTEIFMDKWKEFLSVHFPKKAGLSMFKWDVTRVYCSCCEVMSHYCRNLDSQQKELALKNICQGKYEEKDLVYIRTDYELSSGWAFTKDSFCYGGNLGRGIIPYEDMVDVSFKCLSFRDAYLTISCKDGSVHRWDNTKEGYKLISGLGIYEMYGGIDRIASYLNIVSNL